MVTKKEITLIEGNELLVNAFQISGMSRRYRIPYNWDIFQFGSK